MLHKKWLFFNYTDSKNKHFFKSALCIIRLFWKRKILYFKPRHTPTGSHARLINQKKTKLGMFFVQHMKKKPIIL